MEPLTKVRMELLFPASDGSSGGEVRVGFDGIVVRTEPDAPTSNVSIYRMAVFFTHIPESSSKILSGFIESRIHASGA